MLGVTPFGSYAIGDFPFPPIYDGDGVPVVVRYELRTITISPGVSAQVLTMFVPAEIRTMTLPANPDGYSQSTEPRLIVVPAEANYMTVRPEK